MAPKREILYTPEGDIFKSQYVSFIENSGVAGVNRAIDIILQTPDKDIIPYLQEALAKNPQADPVKLVQAVKGAEHKIFKNFQAAPWDEVHHGRASLSSMRNVRYLSPEERVLALNKTAAELGGPIGNSRFNLRGNSASRAAHTGGSFPWKTLSKERYRDLYDIPRIPTEYSMHPMGTNADKDRRGIVVPPVDTASEFINKAVESSKIQFSDTVTGRQSDIPRRIIADNMLERTPPSLLIGSPMIYGVDADPADVKASKKFFQLPENERLRANIAQASFTLDSPQGQRLMRNEVNRAKAASYIADSYFSGLPMPKASQFKALGRNLLGELPFAATSAIDPLQKGKPTEAVTNVVQDAAIGAATAPVTAPILSKVMPAITGGFMAAPAAMTAAAVTATELLAPRAAGGGLERVTVNGTPYWLDRKANKVFTNDSRPTNFGIQIKGGNPQLVQRGQGVASKQAEQDPIRQAMKGNLMPALSGLSNLNPMTQLLNFSKTVNKTIRNEV